MEGKITKSKRFKYSNIALQQALHNIKDGENIFACSKRTAIPYSTLKKKLKTKSEGKFVKGL